MSSGNPLIRPQLPVTPYQMNPQGDDTEVPVGLGPAPFKPTMPEGGDPRRRIILPGADYPPADAVPVNQFNNATIAAGATATLVTLVIPLAYSLRLSGVGFDADDETALRALSWSITIDPPVSPIVGYANQTGAIGSTRHPAWIFSVQGNGTVRLVATNFNGVDAFFTARLVGWFYREEK